MTLCPPGSCLIFVRSRPLQLSRNLPTAGMVGRRERREKEKEIEFNSNLDNYISTEIEMYLEMHMIWKNFKKRNFKLENGLK